MSGTNSQANTMEGWQVTGPELWVHLHSPTPAFTLTLGPAGSNQPQEPRAPQMPPTPHRASVSLCIFAHWGDHSPTQPMAVPPTPAPQQPQSGRRKV